jgi:hypothetical protein
LENDTGQDLVSIEQAFEKSKADRFTAKTRWDAARGRYHGELTARREAGETLTQTDIKALEACAIDDIPYVKAAYLSFINADTDYRQAKVAWESAKRDYWDNKEKNRGIFK